MRQGTFHQSATRGWKAWVGELISLLMALILTGTIALIGGFEEWDVASVGLLTFALWVLVYFVIFRFLERLTP